MQAKSWMAVAVFLGGFFPFLKGGKTTLLFTALFSHTGGHDLPDAANGSEHVWKPIRSSL
jgi:hypothetical protein